jgi:uncharacterized protein
MIIRAEGGDVGASATFPDTQVYHSINTRRVMMSNTRNVETVQNIYAAFGQGRIPDILERLTGKVVWIQPSGLPWSGTSIGKNEVGSFFGKLDKAVTVERFEPRKYFSAENDVVVLGYWSGKSKTAGKAFESDWVMTWAFEGDKVSHFQAFMDSADLAKQF